MITLTVDLLSSLYWSDSMMPGSKILDSVCTLSTKHTDLEVLTDSNDPKFVRHSKRWSDIGRKLPTAIVLPTTEEEIQITVRWAVSSSIPFVIKGGGHSHWSTIGEEGVVIDLSYCSGIDVDVERAQACLTGSIQAKEVAVALANVGYFTALGNGNSIGAIGYFLGGGVSTVTSVIGFGSDQIVAARMIDAKGNLIIVNEETEPDLLYAIRGAGQFIGLVTQLIIKINPLHKLGSNDGTLWIGQFIFPLSRAEEVGEAMAKVINDGTYATSGMLMIMAPPPDSNPVIFVGGRYIGAVDKAETAFKPLLDLHPLVSGGNSVPIQNINDAFAAMEVKGDYKRYHIVGLHSFNPKRWAQTIDVWTRLVAECPDALRTSFNFQWDSRLPLQPAFESAMSLHDVRLWQNNIIWYTDSANHELVDRFNNESTNILREDDAYVEYQNATREGHLSLRYRPESKVQKLKALKRKWDPQGIFTRQLLD